MMLSAGTLLPAFAQNDTPLEPDRPGLGEVAATVGADMFQVEFGYAYNERSALTSHEIGQLLLRYGVNDHLELRANIDSYVVTDEDAGYNGPGFGVKVHIHETAWASLGAATTVDLPTGNDPFGTIAERPRQDIRLLLESGLDRRLSLSINGGTSFYFADETQPQWFVIPTLDIYPTHRLGVYAGYARFYQEEPDEHWLEAGLTYLLSSDAQLDVNMGRQLDEARNRFFLGFGVAHRF